MIKLARWDEALKQRASGEFPADPLGDLVTTENRLSVFLLEDEAAQLDSVMTACAANKQRAANADCVLLEAGHLDKLALEQELTEGNTPNANVNGLHRNLKDLTAKVLVELGELFLQYGEFKSRLGAQIRKQILDGVRSGTIDSSKLHKKLRKKLDIAT